MKAGRVLLTLEPIGGARWSLVPPAVRLRRLVKVAGRAFGFRVIGARELAGSTPATPPGDDDPDADSSDQEGGRRCGTRR